MNLYVTTLVRRYRDGFNDMYTFTPAPPQTGEAREKRELTKSTTTRFLLGELLPEVVLQRLAVLVEPFDTRSQLLIGAAISLEVLHELLLVVNEGNLLHGVSSSSLGLELLGNILVRVNELLKELGGDATGGQAGR